MPGKGVGFYFQTNISPVAIIKPIIKYYQIGIIMDDFLNGDFKLRFHYFVSAVFKQEAYHVKRIEIVFDNEDLFHSSPGIRYLS